MIKLKAKGLKILKSLHIIFALVWMSGAIAMILITYFADANTGAELLLKNKILLLVDDWMIIVGAMTTLAIGIIYGIFTNWGFFKHKWIIVKWIITVAEILFGTFAYHPRLEENIGKIAQLGEDVLQDPIYLSNASFMCISGFVQAGLLVFLVVISVFKPWKPKKTNN